MRSEKILITYKFYLTMSCIMASSYLLAVHSTATVSGPIEGFLKASVRKRVYNLPVAVLNTVFCVQFSQ
jgi:hypothetical protein